MKRIFVISLLLMSLGACQSGEQPKVQESKAAATLDADREGCGRGSGRWGGLPEKPGDSPRIGENEDVLLAWIECLKVTRDLLQFKKVNETETARATHHQYVFTWGGGGLGIPNWYYYTTNGIITTIQR